MFVYFSKIDGEGGPAEAGGEAPKPEDVPKDETTYGILGVVGQYLWPITSIVLQYVNSGLIHAAKQQLPCTISSVTPLKYTCTPLTPDQQSE